MTLHRKRGPQCWPRFLVRGRIELCLAMFLTAGVNPSRWLTARWLVPGERRGDWIRGPKCPRFDEQHPAAYALALEKAHG